MRHMSNESPTRPAQMRAFYFLGTVDAENHSSRTCERAGIKLNLMRTFTCTAWPPTATVAPAATDDWSNTGAIYATHTHHTHQCARKTYKTPDCGDVVLLFVIAVGRLAAAGVDCVQFFPEKTRPCTDSTDKLLGRQHSSRAAGTRPHAFTVHFALRLLHAECTMHTVLCVLCIHFTQYALQ